MPARKAARIADYTPGDVLRTEQWPIYLDWFVQQQSALRSAIGAIGGIDTLIARTRPAAESPT